ncbi:hypothetical protein PMAYCL1PPCAC_14057, partial [Pristionchus mayeri]
KMRALLVFSALLLAGLATDTPPDCKNGGTPLADNSGCDCPCQTYGQDLCETIVKCENGGVLKDNECQCQSYWGGYFCEEIDCVNGGYAMYATPDVNGRQVCHCPKGYYGIHCDAVKQARPVEGVFNTQKSFILYIHNELSDWYGMSGFARIKRDVQSLVPGYDDAFNSYTLLVSKSGDSSDADFDGPTDWPTFNTSLNALETGRTTMYTCNQAAISYKRILKALQNNHIEDSVMLMYTQYPPTTDDESLAELKKYLRAFRIKLNVLIGADDILLDCNSKSKKNKGFDELTSLVHFTDGEIATFVVEDSDDPNELVPAFIRASASPQSHSRQASATCQKTELVFQTDPYPNTYYIAVRSSQDKPALITGTCSSGGEVSDPILSYYSEFTLFTILSGAQQTCTLSVTTGDECIATVYSVGGENGVDAFDIFHSFSTSTDMDTDSIYAYHNESFYLTLHIEVPKDSIYKIKNFTGDVAVYNEDEREIVLTELSSRQSTFEYQSEGPFACNKYGASWIQLTLQGFSAKGGDSVAVLNRMINLNCEERKPPADSSKLFRMMDEEDQKKKLPTLALMYSNSLPRSQYSKFILEGADASLMETKFSSYGYLRFDGSDTMDFMPTPVFDDFRKGVYDSGPDASLKPLNNIKKELELLTESSIPVTPDSLVSIAISHSMTDPSVNLGVQYPANLAKLANLGAKLLFWGDVDTVTVNEGDSESLEFYTRLAAVSAGHVVLIDTMEFTDDEDDDGEYPFYASLALRDLYSFGPSQRLLAYSNLEWAQTSDVTTQTASIGTLQIPQGTTQVFVSITLNVKNPSDVGQAFQLSIVLEGNSDRPVLNFDSFTTYGGTARPRSNLYTANITVVGGESYEGTFTVLAMTPYTGAHIRFWTERTDDDVIPDLTYVDFDKKTIQPDDYLGAALRVNSDETKMSLRFLDEHGIEGKLLDHDQTVDVTKGVAHFVPYFCTSDQSKTLSKDMYTVEVTYESGFKYYRPLLCGKSKTDPDGNCEKEEGSSGNWYCTESNPPFHRGPSKMLIDCSGVGQVVYSDEKDAENSYKCVCQDGFAGKSCEQSSCSLEIEHLPEEADAAFRTLSFVLLSPAGDEACSALAMNYANDAKQLFDASKSYDNIWQYTFSVYFADGTVKTMYRGQSFGDFLKQFDKFHNGQVDIDTFCGDGPNHPIDLNDVFNVAVESVGRNSRGIVFLYANQNFAEEDKNQLNDAFASNELYQSIQAYQQHIYMVTPTVTPNLITMTTASGGFVVKMIDDFEKYNTQVATYRTMFDSVFKSKVGWAGISTDAKTRSTALKNTWTIRKKAHLFVTSKSADGATPPEVTGLDPTALKQSPFDDVDEDKTISKHAEIIADADNIVKIGITFDKDEAKYELVQVVILTLDDPIQTALIGQSQANTDKQAAGATNSSTKGVHISFDKKSTELFFQPSDVNWRQASRIDCSFAQEFVPFNQPFENIGASVVDFSVSPLIDGTEDPDKTKSFSLSVPLAVSMAIDCVNGDFSEEGSYCACDDGWSGPTCSQPSCGDGVLNSHGDHCDCTGAQFGGLFCKDEMTKMLFEEE